MKRTYLLLLLFTTTTFCYAQGYLKFEKLNHTFGTIKEEDGIKSVVFQFKNTGNKSVKLYSVKGTCGCTTSGWPDQAINPGDSGQIQVNYNPLNRPGRFKKNVTVNSNATNQQAVLSIEGYVQPKPKSPAELFTLKMGNLWAQNKSLNMGKITTEKSVTRRFEVYNGGTKPIVFIPGQTKTADFISVKFDPDTLTAKSTGGILVTFDPTNERLGFSSENLKIYTNEDDLAEKEFFIISTVEEYFPPMTEEEAAKIPVLTFDRASYDFGLIYPNSKVQTAFSITNQGKSDLIIRDIQTNCGCTVAELPSGVIKPGASRELKVIYTAGSRKGRQIKTVTVFSNDPSAPTQMLTIKAEVQ